MKKILSIVLSASVSIASAQWGNTTNYFEDSLHTPVSISPQVQKNAIVLTSYPDNGYFVIWEDDRNLATTKTDIYAQKYDQNGNRLWAADGIPVANGPNNQHYTFGGEQDYRNRSFVATDSAGGFYICYSDDSTGSYIYERLSVQHIRSNGTTVFGIPGYIMARSTIANWPFSAQLIPDGNKGFYLSYKYAGSGSEQLFVYNYRDENGALKFYGGGIVNSNAVESSGPNPCGLQTSVVYPGTVLADYNTWYDGYGNCNIVMYMNANGPQGFMLAFNKVWRARKNARTTTYTRNISGTACPRITNYNKGDVYVLYSVLTDYQRAVCGTEPVYSYTNYRLLSTGFQLLESNANNGYYFPKGVTIATSGTINVDLMAVSKRLFVNNTFTDYSVQGYAERNEKFDSIPYQRCSHSNPEMGNNPIANPSMNKLYYFRDTLLASGNVYSDFSMAGGGSRIFIASLMSVSGFRKVRLQHLEVSKKSADSFAVEYKTNIQNIPEKAGVAIGAELNTTGYITYDLPLVTINSKGQGFFSIRELGRSARVSPIETGVQLAWGAMGKRIGYGKYRDQFYNINQPVVALDSSAGSCIIAWRDDRYYPTNFFDNIFMRHLDKVNVSNYSPPVLQVKQVVNFFGPTFANPEILYGTSKHYSNFDVYCNIGPTPGTSPIMEILDNNYLGWVGASMFQATATRKYNNQPYLNRNYTIKSDSLKPGAKIDMKLYFTKADFDALKAADFSIIDPGYLGVVRQPPTASPAPDTYISVAGEELISPLSWDSVDGGYNIQLVASGTGNFFVQKMQAASVCAAVSKTFTSDVTGAAYQWLVSTGGGYTPVANGANYSGAGTVTLTLTNIPTSFNGYRYRCLVDNTKLSNAYYLQITNTWTGAVNNLWETAGNWSCNTVPDANTDAVINSGTPTVNSNTAICRSLKLAPGANVTVTPGFKLTVTH